MDAAIQQIPMAGSTMDQIETEEVAKRKSTVRFTFVIYAMRTITVSPALLQPKLLASMSKLECRMRRREEDRQNPQHK